MRIQRYDIDKPVGPQDKWIGTDSTTNETKNYTAKGLGNFMNNYGAVAINNQFNYKFANQAPRFLGSISFDTYGGSGTAFSSIGNLMLSEKDLASREVTIALQYLIGSYVLLRDVVNPNNFGHYILANLVPDPTEAGYMNMTVVYQGGNGSIQKDTVYGLSSFQFGNASPGPVNGDKFKFIEITVPSTTWAIQHDMGKFPSCEVLDSDRNKIITSTRDLDLNNLIVEFAKPRVGSVKLN